MDDVHIYRINETLQIGAGVTADVNDWKRKFGILYNKYGGTVQGETKL